MNRINAAALRAESTPAGQLVAYMAHKVLNGIGGRTHHCLREAKPAAGEFARIEVSYEHKTPHAGYDTGRRGQFTPTVYTCGHIGIMQGSTGELTVNFFNAPDHEIPDDVARLATEYCTDYNTNMPVAPMDKLVAKMLVANAGPDAVDPAVRLEVSTRVTAAKQALIVLLARMEELETAHKPKE